MLAPTHAAFGVATSLIFLAIAGISLSLHWTVMTAAVIGALLPDIDVPKSVMGRLFLPISRPLERHFGHRTITHSLVGLSIATILAALFIFLAMPAIGFLLSKVGVTFTNFTYLSTRWLAAFSIGYISHLIIDMFNKRGVQMFWPNKSRDIIISNPRYRMESGDSKEIMVFVIVVIIAILALPLSKYGLMGSLHWVLATTGSAIEEFKVAKDVTRLEFDGYFRQTRTPIKTSAEILDFEKGRLIIYMRPHVYSISDQLASDITARNMRVAHTKKPLKIEKREVTNMSWNEFLRTLPEKALISGTLVPPDGFTIHQKPAPKESIQTISIRDGKLVLYFTNKRELQALVARGSLGLERQKLEAHEKKLRAQIIRTEADIKSKQNPSGLTSEGAELLMTEVDRAARFAELSELQARLDELKVALAESREKQKSTPHTFNGELVVRHL